jgi:hypothetical protein
MKRRATVFLQGVILAVGAAALALLLGEPHLEGVNAGKAFFAVYLDPFLWLVYVGAIPFFVALFQGFRVLGCVRRGKVFSPMTVQAFRMIKYCALLIIGFVAAEEIVILANHGNDDATGGIMLGLLIASGSIVVALLADVFEGILRKAVEEGGGIS